jgi:hypothetical protein
MGTVLHRVTLELLESVNTPDFNPGLYLVNPDLSAVIGQPKKYWKVVGSNVVLKTLPEQATADKQELPATKRQLLDAVDSKSEALITDGPGLEHPIGSGKFISMSMGAQLKWIGWQDIADDWTSLGLPYPFRVRTRYDDDFIEIQNAAEVKAVLGEMAQLIAKILTEAEYVKAAIVKATTLTDAESAADKYLEATTHQLLLSDLVDMTDDVAVVLEVLFDAIEITDLVTNLLTNLLTIQI